MKEIPLSQGKFALVDDCDYEFLSQWKWYFDRYAVRNKQKIEGARGPVRMHRAVAARMGLVLNGQEIDHYDTNKLNNCRINLREATQGENCLNRPCDYNNKSRLKGVSQHTPGGSWQAFISLNYQVHYLGSFPTPEEASAAYDQAAKELHGDFARINGVATFFTGRRRIRRIGISGFRGVSPAKGHKRWRARIRIHKREIPLGLFDTKEEAAKAYNEAALKYFGEFAYQNKL